MRGCVDRDAFFLSCKNFRVGKRRRQRDSTGRDARARAKTAQVKSAALAADLKPAERLEDRLTVFWMLTTLFTLATMTLGLAAFVYYALTTPADGAAGPNVVYVYDYARFATAVMSLMSLVMTPIVLWMRHVPPPRAITLFVLATATLGLSWALFTAPLHDSDSEAPEPGIRATSP